MGYSFPNQKHITVSKEACDSQHYYTAINLEALQRAMQRLNGSELKLWLYFAKNKNHYSFELTRADCELYGIKKDSYYRSVTNLILLGYLVQEDINSRNFIFYEIPDPSKARVFWTADE